MSKHYDKWLKVKQNCASELHRVFEDAIKRGDTQARINVEVCAVLHRANGSPRWVHSELYGIAETWRHIIGRHHTVFVYELPCGQRFEVNTQGTDTSCYPSTKLHDASEFSDAPGFFVWKHNKNLHFISDDMKARLAKQQALVNK